MALVLSLIVNAAALRLAARSAAPGRARGGAAPVALAPLSAEEWNANRAVPAPAPAPPPPERGRIVQLSPAQPEADAAPDGARFLSDRNTRAGRETAARHPGPLGDGAAAPRASAGAAARARGPERQARAAPSTARGGRGRSGGPELSPAPDGEIARGAPGSGSGPAARDRRSAPDLSLPDDTLARIAGMGGADHVEDVEEGDETWLDSREFRFATFLNQIRREIGEVWYPRVGAAVRSRDPDGSALFYRERTVVLTLTLDARGEVRALSVQRSSEVDFVDAIAVSSVREAQPFPNPPRAMFEGEGEVRIPFAFTIYPADRGAALRWRAPRRR